MLLQAATYLTVGASSDATSRRAVRTSLPSPPPIERTTAAPARATSPRSCRFSSPQAFSDGQSANRRCSLPNPVFS